MNVLAEKDDLAAYFKEAEAKVVVTLDLFEEKVLTAADRCGVEKVFSFGVDYEMPLPLKVGYKLKTRKRKPINQSPSSVIGWNGFLKHSKGQPCARM